MNAAMHGAPVSVMIARAPRGSEGTRWLGLGVVILLHLVALFFLLRQGPVRETLKVATPLLVNLVTPPKVEMPPPPPPPPPPRARPKPRLEPIKTPEPPPLMAAPTMPALTEFVSPPPVAPALPAEPAGSASTAPAAPSVPSPTSAPPAVVPPSFNAAYLRNEPPRYPNASRRTGEQGRVMMRVYVSATGVPEKVELHTSSGFERLDQAALETVRTWKFVPAHRGGKPIAAWVQVPITFALAH